MTISTYKTLILILVMSAAVPTDAQVSVCPNCPISIGDAVSTVSPTTTTMTFDIDCTSNCDLSTYPLDFFTVDFQHEYLGDLEITLIAPDGSSVDFTGPYCNGGLSNPSNTNNSPDQSKCDETDRNYTAAGNTDDNIGDRFVFKFVAPSLSAEVPTTNLNNADGTYHQNQVNTYIYDNCSPFPCYDSYSVYMNTFFPSAGSSLSNLTGSVNGTWMLQITDRFSTNGGEALALTFKANDASMGVAVLPVELHQFTTVAQDESVLIRWVTASEYNNEGFEIQRSTDGFNFEKIAWRDGAGHSDKDIPYQYIDYSVANSTKYYYRLRQIDFDGAESFSDIKVITTLGKKDIVTIQPQPVPSGEQIQLSIKTLESKKGIIQIFNLTGQELFSQRVDTQMGDNLITLSNPNLSKGNYFVKLTLNENSYYQKMIIQ